MLRLSEIARSHGGKLPWNEFERVTKDFGVHGKNLRDILILCERKGIKFVDEHEPIDFVGKLETFFDCAELLSKTSRSHDGKISWHELNTIAQSFDLDDAQTLDKLSTFCQRAGIKLTNEQLAPVVEHVKPAPEIDLDALINKLLSNVAKPAAGHDEIISALIERHKRNGRLTWSDLEWSESSKVSTRPRPLSKNPLPSLKNLNRRPSYARQKLSRL